MNPNMGRTLIESDRVEGTTVYTAGGERIGAVRRMMIEKVSGRVVYVVIAFQAWEDLPAEDHTIPWGKLHYDTEAGGYRTDVTPAELRHAPRPPEGEEHDWREHEEALLAFWRIPPYFRAI